MTPLQSFRIRGERQRPMVLVFDDFYRVVRITRYGDHSEILQSLVLTTDEVPELIAALHVMRGDVTVKDPGGD